MKHILRNLTASSVLAPVVAAACMAAIAISAMQHDYNNIDMGCKLAEGCSVKLAKPAE